MKKTIYAETCFLVKEPNESVLEAAKVRNLASMAERLNELEGHLHYTMVIRHVVEFEHNPHNTRYAYPKLITRMYISRDDKEEEL